MIIGISGKFCSGKDTLAQIIIQYYQDKGYETKHLKIADGLKKICSIITGSSMEDQYTQEGKSKTNCCEITNGRLQQLVGTVLREEINPNIWIFPVMEYCKNNPDTICIISDCRFKNEAQIIKQNGGILIRINRMNEIHNSQNGRDHNHVSETDLDNYKFDYVIENNGTLQDLKNTAQKILFY